MFKVTKSEVVSLLGFEVASRLKAFKGMFESEGSQFLEGNQFGSPVNLSGPTGTACSPSDETDESIVESLLESEVASRLESCKRMFESGGSQFLEGNKFGWPFNLSGLPGTACSPSDEADERIASRKRSERQGDVIHIPRHLTHGYNHMVTQKYTCIWSRGGHSWREALSGIMWVAVHGMDSICVVTRIKDLEYELTLRMAMLGEEPEILLRIFRNGLIAQVEDFADPFSIPHRLLHQTIKKPFGVVSVIPVTKIVRTGSGDKVLSDKYDEENAIKFLQNEIESGVAFTFDKTVQTAICALDHLFHQEFKANEIQVFVWRKDGGHQAEALSRVREDLDIEEHIAAINKPDMSVR